ncbi:hypothetical protein [Streptomyces sp. NPDC001970]
MRVIVVKRKATSVELTLKGYVVTCPGTDAVGHGPTESDAWLDFWQLVHAEQMPKDVALAAASERLPARRARWLKVRTIRVRDLFG